MSSAEAQSRIFKALDAASDRLSHDLECEVGDGPVLFYDPNLATDLAAAKVFHRAYELLNGQFSALGEGKSAALDIPAILGAIPTQFFTFTATYAAQAGPADPSSYVLARVLHGSPHFFDPANVPLLFASDKDDIGALLTLQNKVNARLASRVRSVAAALKGVIGEPKGRKQRDAWKAFDVDRSAFDDARAAGLVPKVTVVQLLSELRLVKDFSPNADSAISTLEDNRKLDGEVLVKASVDALVNVLFGAPGAAPPPTSPGSSPVANPPTGSALVALLQGLAYEVQLNNPKTHILKVKVEVASGTDLQTTWMWVHNKRSSGAAVISYELFDNNLNGVKAGTVRAFVGFDGKARID